MNDAGEKDENQPDEESIPTSSSGPGIVGLGEQIGRYKLLRILGEGGFGIVYLAEQQRPMKRQVALKIIKPGMDSAQVIRRFEAERQALALLDHPNVAHVYDAGTTKSGRPYFAMEYVKGVPITEHCDRQRLTIEERLKLFVKVCEAIQHAHQKGIIHRDIKPSNIQVCIEGEEAIPKVIDFGVAKALSQPLTERTLVTEQGQLIGTPEYISPEQAEMTNQDIDTRADIYSLGVLLYELLTGTLPFESQTLRRGSLEQMRAVLREEEPKTPSTRVSTLDVEASTRVARCCQSDTATLRRKLRGDLDWITLKAMEKDRTRRYQTAHALAEDIERHLNNEPVLAGRPGTLYRFQKLVRRNRGVFAAATVVAAVLVLGALVSTWQAARATRAEREQSQLREAAVAAQEKETALRYASDMSLAQQALAKNDLGRAWRLLEDYRPAPGQVDLRGWEWRYLWQKCQSDANGILCSHPDSAYSVAYSPDGKRLAVSGFIFKDLGFVEIWDVPGRKRIATLQPKEGCWVAFSPGGDLLATNAGKDIRLWRTDTWKLVADHTLPGAVVCFKFSPDGKQLAILSRPYDVTVCEVDQWTFRRIRSVRLGNAYTGSLDFSPDGKALVIGGDEDPDHHLQVIDLASGNTNFDIPKAHLGYSTVVAWSPNGSMIASGRSTGPIRLWEASSGKPLGELKGHTSWISQLIFSADGRWLYSASVDQTIRIWDVGEQRLLATLRGSRDEIYGLALAPDGAMLASAGKDGVVAFWSAVPRPEERLPGVIVLGRMARRPAFAPDSRVLAAPHAGTASLFDLATCKEIEQISKLGADVLWVVYSPDGTLLASGCKGKTRVWSFAERRLLQELGDPNANAPIFPVGFRADGTRLLAYGARQEIIWLDTSTWQPVHTYTLPTANMEVCECSPDGRLLAIGGLTGTLRWLNAETGEFLAASPTIHRHRVGAIAFSQDGSRAASVADDGTVAIWDTSSFEPIATFKGHAAGHYGVAFSPDRRRLATCVSSTDAVKLWDLSTGRELVTLSGQGTQFSSVDFSPNGQWLAACDSDEGTLHLWRAPSWEEIEAAEKKQGRQSP